MHHESDIRAHVGLLVLCGLPGSGKTTLATTLQSLDKGLLLRCTHVQFDEVAKPSNSSVPSFDPAEWKSSRATALKKISALLAEPLGPGFHLVIADDTMHYRSLRRECYQLARDAGAAYVQAHVDCPIDVALRRNSQRPDARRVPEHVLRRAADVFEAPSQSSERWEVDSTVHVDAMQQADAVAVWNCVWIAWGGPPKPLPDELRSSAELAAARASTAESAAHQADLACRQLLAEALQRLAHLAARDKADVAKALNDARRLQLAGLREHGREDAATAQQQAVAAFRKRCEVVVRSRLAQELHSS